MAKIPMCWKELQEARRVGIPESIIGKMVIGIEPNEKEKEIINKLGKVYVEAHKKNGKWVKPQLRDLPGGKRVIISSSKSKEEVEPMSEEEYFDELTNDIIDLMAEGKLEQDYNSIEQYLVENNLTDRIGAEQVIDRVMEVDMGELGLEGMGGIEGIPSKVKNNPEFKFIYPEGKWVGSGNTISPEDKIVLGNKGQVQLVREGDSTSMRVDYNQLKETLGNQIKHAKIIRDGRWEDRLKKERKNLEELYKRAERNTQKPYKHWKEYRFERAVAEGHFIPD